jgi:PIN domain nuclease of toxin-antitoxin system
MRVLVDTHALFWWLLDKPELSQRARSIFTAEDNEILVSAVVAWELAMKTRLGKWPEALPLAVTLSRVIEENRFLPLAVTIEHARNAGLLSGSHRDPFDRMLAAQSLIEGIPLLSADRVFATFGTAVIW